MLKSIIPNPKAVIIFVILSAMVAAFFIAFPQVDIYVSGLFFDPVTRFYLGANPLLEAVHKSVTYMVIAFTALWIILLALSFIKQQPVWGISRRNLIYLLLALAIGPGLVVNTIFKDNWGRARPHHIEQFGGSKTFTPPFILSDQCEKNCSFVSGDPSVGFYLFALALAIPRKKRLFTALAIGVGASLGATRIMMGAHFLSDVIFSGIFTFASCYLLYVVMQVKALSHQRQNMGAGQKG